MNDHVNPRPRAILELEDGTSFEGWAFGSRRSAEAEVVFTTGMAGYPQTLTDPSYQGQIIVSTYPLMGNYGVPGPGKDGDGISLNFESERVWASGLVVSGLCESPSHYLSERSLGDWLEAEDVPGMAGVDTRRLTSRLRERGVMRGSIRVEDGTRASGKPVPEESSVARVSCGKVIEYGAKAGGKAPLVALVDCGVKNNILRSLLAKGSRVLRLPWDSPLDDPRIDAILLSNGPGDPKACSRTIAQVRKAMEGGLPIFGICLGSQIMALAAGADTYKLGYGHRGQNQPCVETSSGRCYMTSQNHGYAVRAESLPPGWEVWFANGNDGSVEGIRSRDKPFSGVQFHPEGCPGPQDTDFLIDAFVAEAKASSRRRA